MLQSAQFRNFKALRGVSIDLERFTVLVGANGCGKTSVLEAIDLVYRTWASAPARQAVTLSAACCAGS